MTKPKTDIDPRAIAADFFRKLGGMEGMTKWGKTHRSLAYQLIAKLMAQPLVQTNVNVNNVRVDGEDARRKIENALMRIIDARKAAVGDPAVYVDGERINDGHFIEHEPQAMAQRLGMRDGISHTVDLPPATDATRPATADPPPSTADPRPQPPAVPPRTVVRSFVAGQTAGVALDGSDDNRSTTQKFMDWSGHGKMF
jgi:hypothetical protein